MSQGMEASPFYLGRAWVFRRIWVEAIGPRQPGTGKIYLGICQGNAFWFQGVSLSVKPGDAWKGPRANPKSHSSLLVQAHANYNSVHP